jgi:hypothetical protein
MDARDLHDDDCDPPDISRNDEEGFRQFAARRQQASVAVISAVSFTRRRYLRSPSYMHEDLASLGTIHEVIYHPQCYDVTLMRGRWIHLCANNVSAIP